LGINSDQSAQPFQTIEAMRTWRNSLVHASPYSIETVLIVETEDSTDLHHKIKQHPYTRTVRIDHAKAFYAATFHLIDLVKKASGLDPRAMCSYKPM
jgi:Na+/H+ antiporter NhaC